MTGTEDSRNNRSIASEKKKTKVSSLMEEIQMTKTGCTQNTKV